VASIYPPPDKRPWLKPRLFRTVSGQNRPDTDISILNHLSYIYYLVKRLYSKVSQSMFVKYTGTRKAAQGFSYIF
jgi:hypothetical protein